MSQVPPIPPANAPVRTCPLCLESIHPEAQRCPNCRSWLMGNPLQSEWYRGGPESRIAGVCAGLARQFSISATIIRLLFVLATIFGGGIGLVLYILLWFIMPKLSDAVPHAQANH